MPAVRRTRILDVSTPAIELATGFILDERGRIVSTREPQATSGPLFIIVRSATQCAWAIRHDVPSDVAEKMAALAAEESPIHDLRAAPMHADEYVALSGGQLGFSGPAFTFPERSPLPQTLSASVGVVQVDDERYLQRNFRGWELGEIGAGRAPVMAVIEDGYPVSICFCARRSESAAAAGLETAEAFRGRGFGSRVTAAWALAIRATGRVPLYSAAWTNAPSLAVARKLGLTPHASEWSVSE
jgi:hypothetical protein